MKTILPVILIGWLISCNTLEKKTESVEMGDPVDQIGQYVTGIFEDTEGNLWMGTIENGMAKYDGKVLRYYSEKDGLPSSRVTSVTEDAEGVLWLNTDAGISKYDGGKFTNYRIEEDDDLANIISQLFIDSEGDIWIGTWRGVYRFDGTDFRHFPLPCPEVATSINDDTKDWITGIKEDLEGNLWFSRDGYGVAKYDGTSFTHYLKKDGLLSNNVTSIEVDDENNLWLGMRNGDKDNSNQNGQIGKGGVNKLTDQTIISFPETDALVSDDVYEVYQDDSGSIWVSTTQNGVFKYEDKAFKNYEVPISIMTMTNDGKGNLWLGGAGGLYRIGKDGSIVNVRRNGPWE